MKKLFILIFIFSCSYTKYKAPSVVYRAPISSKMDPSSKNFTAENLNKIKNLSRTIKNKGKLLVLYQNYDLFDYSSTANFAQNVEYGVDIFIEKLESESIFKQIKKVSLSHIKVYSINDILEVSRLNDADYFILLSSSYNYYKYSNTLGYFLGWLPIVNYFSPIHVNHIQLFLQIEFFNNNGAGLFTEAILNEKEENVSSAFSSEHLSRINTEINHNTYINAAMIVAKKYKEDLKN